MYYNHKEEKIKSKNLGLIVDDMNEMLYIILKTINNEEQLKYYNNLVLSVIINIGKIKNKKMDKKDYVTFEKSVFNTYEELIKCLGIDFKKENDFSEKSYYKWIEEYYTNILEEN